MIIDIAVLWAESCIALIIAKKDDVVGQWLVGFL